MWKQLQNQCNSRYMYDSDSLYSLPFFPSPHSPCAFRYSSKGWLLDHTNFFVVIDSFILRFKNLLEVLTHQKHTSLLSLSLCTTVCAIKLVCSTVLIEVVMSLTNVSHNSYF